MVRSSIEEAEVVEVEEVGAGVVVEAVHSQPDWKLNDDYSGMIGNSILHPFVAKSKPGSLNAIISI